MPLYQVILEKVMLRRQKNQILNGKPLIELPDRIVEIVDCEFDAVEKEFYNELEDRMKDTVDKIMQQEKRSYTSVLLLLLRLRQGKLGYTIFPFFFVNFFCSLQSPGFDIGGLHGRSRCCRASASQVAS
jgi:SNF2 family DNA or RNA helicase